MRALDIGIVGAGVAGLACGALLRRAGHRVVIFDRLERPSPIGSGLILQPVGLAVLETLGVRACVEGQGARLARLWGLSRGKPVLDVRYAALSPSAYGVGAHRGALFSALFEAAQAAGVEIEARREAVAAPLMSGDRRAIAFSDGTATPAFDLVLDAAGVRSPLSRAAAPLRFGALWANLAWRDGFAADALEQRYEAARKMAGVMPIGGGQAAYFWSLRGADHAAWRAAPLDAWKDEARALWPQTAPLLDQISSHDDLVFARYAHRTHPRPVDTALARVGDSYHCASPQLGQGANMALLDAAALAQALAAQDDVGLALAEYARLRALHVWIYQAASWAFTPAYQSDGALYPWVRDVLMARAARFWFAPKLLAALVAGRWGM